MSLFSLDELKAATTTVRTLVPPTPAYAWPLLARRTGVDVVVKHENHTPTGSFKARGGLVYVESLRRAGSLPNGLVTATRGNHGQSVAIAASRVGIPALIVVPEGNSAEKNAAMVGFGGELIVAGKDFDESRVVAERLAHERNYHLVPSFHRELVKGVATYAQELFSSRSDLDVIYVPIGMGSGICGLITCARPARKQDGDCGRCRCECAGVRPFIRIRPVRINEDRADICRWHGVPRTAPGAG